MANLHAIHLVRALVLREGEGYGIILSFLLCEGGASLIAWPQALILVGWANHIPGGCTCRAGWGPFGPPGVALV